jgi:hypothetical protein
MFFLLLLFKSIFQDAVMPSSKIRVLAIARLTAWPSMLKYVIT